ncbi:putative DNA-binding protein Hu [Streptomyces sp. 769]|nr:putative DNA-binding protein Hu [Streptomyces sp. 769]
MAGPRTGPPTATTDPELEPEDHAVNKAQLVEAVKDQIGGSRKTATTAVEAVLDTIVRAVVEGEAVSVTGFGSIAAHDRAARISRNPQTGAEMHVPATRVLRFAPGRKFKDLASGRAPLPASGNAIRKAPKSPRP